MPGRWRLVPVACAFAAAVTMACGTAPPEQRQVTSSAPPAAPAAATPSPAPLSAWQRRGATEVPPTDLQRVTMDGIQVVNQSHGAVTDADARAWAAALLRAINFEFWAVNRLQDRFLLQSGLSTAPVVVFQPDLTDIAGARSSSSRVEYTRKVFRRMLLRPVPDALRQMFSNQLATWKPYAFYLDAVGPATRRVTDATGNQTTKTLFQPGEPAFELVGGELVHDPMMGDVFAVASDWDCMAPSNRQKLAPLCNP
jgi:hypothetical protein